MQVKIRNTCKVDISFVFFPHNYSKNVTLGQTTFRYFVTTELFDLMLLQYPAGYQKEKENKNEVEEEEAATPSKSKRKRKSQGSGECCLL